MRRRFGHLLAGIAALGGLALATPPADAAIVERIVAVVGERPILLSELRLRARPYLYRAATMVSNPSQLAAAESEVFHEVLNRMIDDRLEEQAADKAHLSVTPEEVDNGIRFIASQNHVDVKRLVEEAKRSGLTEQDHRDEVRRQLLEEKLIQLRVRGRVRVTDQDARAVYDKAVRDAAQQTMVDLRILVLRIAPGATQQDIQVRTTLGEEIARRGRSGEDWCKLVLNYSDDPTTKEKCGSNGPLAMQALLPELQQVASTLKLNEISDPIFFRDPQGQQVLLVVQIGDSPGKLKIPAFEELKDQMTNKAFQEAIDRQKKLWLQELRHGVYIDTRL